MIIDRDAFNAEQLARLWQETFRQIAEEITFPPNLLPWEDLPEYYRGLLITTAAEVLNELDRTALLAVTKPRMGWGNDG